MDAAVAIHMCRFIEEECSPDREYIKSLTDAKSIITIPNMLEESSCSYKVEALTGAPGFNVDMTQFTSGEYTEYRSAGSRPEVEAAVIDKIWNQEYEAFRVTWLEYDSIDIDFFQNTTWPSEATVSTLIDCDTRSCLQGDLPNRASG